MKLIKKILALPHIEVQIPETTGLNQEYIRGKALGIDKKWRDEVARMRDTILKAVRESNGQTEERIIKNKATSLSDVELEMLLRELLIKKGYKCAITGRDLSYDIDWLRPSADRIDSNRHYTKDNIQIVSKAVNKAKSDIHPDEVNEYFDALQYSETL